MAFCPADCEEQGMLPNPPADCELDIREQGIDRIGFFTCDTTLPEPFTCGALQTLVDNNVLVFSSPLAEIEIADPTQEQVRVAACLPAKNITTERVINFQDRVKKDVPSTTTPSSPAVPYYENDFWADKVGKAERLRYMLVMCDGSVQVAKDSNGFPLEATLNAFRSYENIGSGGTQKSITYIKGTLTFAGDPLDLNNKPELDASNVPFNLKSCSL
jgi:hypothetical protein